MPIDYEAEYNNRARVPEHPDIFARWTREAEEQFRMVLDDDPFDAECLVSLGELYEKAGMTSRAQTLFERATNSDPGNVEAQKKLDANRPGESA